MNILLPLRWNIIIILVPLILLLNILILVWILRIDTLSFIIIIINIRMIICIILLRDDIPFQYAALQHITNPPGFNTRNIGFNFLINQVPLFINPCIVHALAFFNVPVKPDPKLLAWNFPQPKTLWAHWKNRFVAHGNWTWRVLKILPAYLLVADLKLAYRISTNIMRNYRKVIIEVRIQRK